MSLSVDHSLVLNHLLEAIPISYLISTSIVLFLSYKLYKLITFDEIIGNPKDCKVNDHFDWKRLYKLEELPPFYPNGWISVLESRDLKKNSVRAVSALGYDLLVFRGNSGKAYVFDAYCPHLGANLGIGGQVIGDSIRCPFHGWTFDSHGVCSDVPNLDCSSLPKAQIKVWNSLEINGFIFVWHHSDGQKAEWFPIRVDEIENKEMIYRGRAEHLVNCHLQEIPENGADVMHLNELHSDPEFLGTVADRPKCHKLIQKYVRYEWTANWRPCEAPDQHIARLDLRSKYSVLGYPVMPFSLDVQQIGPANVHLKIHIDFYGQLNAVIIQTITPLGPMKNKIVHHFYTEPTLKAFIFSKFMIYGEARMIERDIVIWNNKKFLRQPHFARNEMPLLKFRRWFSQFYTDKSPKAFH